MINQPINVVSGIVDKITAALDEAEARLLSLICDAPVPWRDEPGSNFTAGQSWVTSADGGMVLGWTPPDLAASIAETTNREARQIRHAREMIDDHAESHTCSIEPGCDFWFDRDDCPVIKSLAAVWCPEGTQ